MYWYRSLSNQPTYESLKYKESVHKKIGGTFTKFLLIILFMTFVLTIFKAFYYVDVMNDCYIRIRHDVLKKDRIAFIEAIKEIKAEDTLAYANLCTYVDTIYEKRCIQAENDRPNISFINSNGCYIKGSKSILINSSNKKEAILLYSGMSKQYWENK